MEEDLKKIEDVKNKIIHADVLDGLAMIPDNSVSLVFTSSPYNVNIPYRNHKDGMPYELYLDWLKDVWKECYRVLRVGGRLAINIDSMVNHEEDRMAKTEDDTGKEYFRPIVADLCNMNKKIGYNYRCDICWYKHQVVGRATAWGSYMSCSNPIVRRNHEYILVWNKGPWRLEPPEKGVKSDMTDEEFQRWTMSYWPISPETQNRGGHEVPFPIRLARPVIKLYSYPGDIVLDPFVGCYDVKTEVLTKNGWKFFKDLKGNELFLTRHTDGSLLYVEAENYQKYKYIGNMFRIKSRRTDLLVTPDHNMYLVTHSSFCSNKEVCFVKAKNMNKTLYRIPVKSSYDSGKDKFSEDEMFLFGAYLSEGYIENNCIIICQNKGEKYNIFMQKLSSFEPYSRDGDRKIAISVNSDFMHLLIDNCGIGSKSKFISEDILNNKYLDALFYGMMLGDGSFIYSKKHEKFVPKCYYTSSEKLSDNFQELCIKLGYGASKSSRDRSNGPFGQINGRDIIPTGSHFEISITNSSYKKIIPKNHISNIDYDDYVYCVTIPNHVLCVRRNGYASWCGNSGTTALAAHMLGRHYIGIDNDKKTVEYAKNRIDDSSDIFAGMGSDI